MKKRLQLSPQKFASRSKGQQSRISTGFMLPVKLFGESCLKVTRSQSQRPNPSQARGQPYRHVSSLFRAKEGPGRTLFPNCKRSTRRAALSPAPSSKGLPRTADWEVRAGKAQQRPRCDQEQRDSGWLLWACTTKNQGWKGEEQRGRRHCFYGWLERQQQIVQRSAYKGIFLKRKQVLETIMKRVSRHTEDASAQQAPK